MEIFYDRKISIILFIILNINLFSGFKVYIIFRMQRFILSLHSFHFV